MKSKFVKLSCLPKLNKGASVNKHIGGSNGDESSYNCSCPWWGHNTGCYRTAKSC